jgi:hypothetical protein
MVLGFLSRQPRDSKDIPLKYEEGSKIKLHGPSAPGANRNKKGKKFYRLSLWTFF